MITTTSITCLQQIFISLIIFSLLEVIVFYFSDVLNIVTTMSNQIQKEFLLQTNLVTSNKKSCLSPFLAAHFSARKLQWKWKISNKYVTRRNGLFEYTTSQFTRQIRNDMYREFHVLITNKIKNKSSRTIKVLHLCQRRQIQREIANSES